MHSADATEQQRSVPRLVQGWEDRGGALSPAEGFLLSRIDGCTSWEMLRQIGGLSPEEADRCLQRWLAQGILELEEGAGGREQAGRVELPPARTVIPRGEDAPGEVDPSLDLPVELQQRILEFESGLDRPYHALLGVSIDADERDIKRAYFRPSKDFHPDIYFGREIGPFAARLDRIFKAVALAYELLIDPATRAEVRRSAPAPEPEPTRPAASGQAPPRKLGKRELLERLRKQFRIPPEIIAERRARAHELHEAARVAAHQGRWNDAGSNIRLAIAFDPWSDVYKDTFAEVQVEVNQLRAAEMLERAQGAFDSRSQEEALRLYEDVLLYRPADPKVNERAAAVACEIGDVERAREYAERACELAPDDATNRVTLGRVLRRAGLKEKARKAFQAALRFDPEHPIANQELERLRRKPAADPGGRR